MPKILAILGGLIALIEGIIKLTSLGKGKGDIAQPIVMGIIAIILAIIVLYSVFKPDDPIPYNGVVILILGILIIIVGSLIGGIILIIAAVLLLV